MTESSEQEPVQTPQGMQLAGIFLLCLAQEQLYYFRTTVRVGERPAASEDLSAPIVPKPYRCESPAKEPATMTNYPWTRGCTEPRTNRPLAYPFHSPLLAAFPE